MKVGAANDMQIQVIWQQVKEHSDRPFKTMVRSLIQSSIIYLDVLLLSVDPACRQCLEINSECVT